MALACCCYCTKCCSSETCW